MFLFVFFRKFGASQSVSLSPDHSPNALPYILPSPLPQPTRKPKRAAPAPETPQRTSTKRPLPMEDADGVIDLEPTPKKPRSSVPTAQKRKFEADGPSPSKRRRLEEEGVVVMDGPDEVLEIDVTDGQPAAAPAEDADYIVIDDD
jgi:ubiquitin-like 1-activating enzyme E1 B